MLPKRTFTFVQPVTKLIHRFANHANAIGPTSAPGSNACRTCALKAHCIEGDRQRRITALGNMIATLVDAIAGACWPRIRMRCVLAAIDLVEGIRVMAR